MLVARVSGMSFADFTQQRIFAPLKMTRTSWRDDHRRIVKGRAKAYGESGGRYQTLMPFEDVHGNGGLLTTVADLLTWNENFTTHVIGDAAFARDLEAPGRFDDGREHGYALGLMVGTRYGLREVAHSGSTAGYTAHVTRFPEQQLSVAVLCNASSGNATQSANAVAAIYLGERARNATTTGTHVLTADEAAKITGLYRSTLAGAPMTLVATDRGIRVERSTQFVPLSAGRFLADNGDRLEIDGDTVTRRDRYGSVESFQRTAAARPSADSLAQLTGPYVSDDAELTLIVAIENGGLVIKRRPDTTIRLTPVYEDAFSGSIGTVIFRRGKTMELSVVQDRVWDLRFTRRDPAVTTAR
jgi:CubicO group peptidase (beta-lactamase class C family)